MDKEFETIISNAIKEKIASNDYKTITLSELDKWDEEEG